MAADLCRALSKRGATVTHHGTAAGHAPSNAPADITVDWQEGPLRRRLLVEVAKRTDESELTSLVAHLDRAVDAHPAAAIDVLYSGLSTSVRMARFLRDENQRREDLGRPGRLIFLALDRLQEYLDHWVMIPAAEAPPAGLVHAASRWPEFTTDVAAARVLQAALFPRWSDRAAALDAERQRELAIRQERLRKDITGLENRPREKGITGGRAHKALIHLLFFALHEDQQGEESRATRKGFEHYKTTMSEGDRSDYADRTIHPIFQRELCRQKEIERSGLLAQYEYPLWSSWSWRPGSVGFQQSVCENDEFAHDGGDGDLCGLSGLDEAAVGFDQVRVEAAGDEGRHVERGTQPFSSTPDVGSASPAAGLPRARGQPGQGGGLLGIDGAQFGQIDEKREGRVLGDAGDRDEDVEPAHKN